MYGSTSRIDGRRRCMVVTNRIDGRMRLCMAAPAELMAALEDVCQHQQNWRQDENMYGSTSRMMAG
jgi:hypothetical protein